MALTFSIITVSDTCFAKEKNDTAGPLLRQKILDVFPSSEIYKTAIVPDDVDKIKEELLSNINASNIIFTVGGTGFSKRDVTPEATKQVIDREANGLSYAMLSKSLQVTDFAMLSRAVCGIKGKSIIINLPGSSKAALECFGFIQKAIPHAVDLLLDRSSKVKTTHNNLQNNLSCSLTINPAERSRTSKFPMLDMDQATKTVLSHIEPLNSLELVPVEKSLHRILAHDVVCKQPIPAVDTSIKDGYAVKSSDGVGVRKVRSAVAAGSAPVNTPLQNGEVIRISTGAPVPLGADAVVQVEDTSLVKSEGGEEVEVSINVEPKVGQDIRFVGSDVRVGELVIKGNSRITAAHIGVLAMLGYTDIHVHQKPSVGIISTGNELRQPGEALKPGQIIDSNKPTLMNLLKEYYYEGNDCGVARDTPEEVLNVLTKAFEKNDVVISSGGVSMGEFDLIKPVLVEYFKADVHFGRINMKPGKPTTFATLIFNGKTKYFFGLPGNPVSSGVTCVLFVIPTLRKLERSTDIDFPVAKCVLKDSLRNRDVRPEYVRVSVVYKNGALVATSTGSQVSSRLNSLLGANGLMVVPGNTEQAQDQSYDTVIISNVLFE